MLLRFLADDRHCVPAAAALHRLSQPPPLRASVCSSGAAAALARRLQGADCVPGLDAAAAGALLKLCQEPQLREQLAYCGVIEAWAFVLVRGPGVSLDAACHGLARHEASAGGRAFHHRPPARSAAFGAAAAAAALGGCDAEGAVPRPAAVCGDGNARRSAADH